MDDCIEYCVGVRGRVHVCLYACAVMACMLVCVCCDGERMCEQERLRVCLYMCNDSN